MQIVGKLTEKQFETLNEILSQKETVAEAYREGIQALMDNFAREASRLDEALEAVFLEACKEYELDGPAELSIDKRNGNIVRDTAPTVN